MATPRAAWILAAAASQTCQPAASSSLSIFPLACCSGCGAKTPPCLLSGGFSHESACLYSLRCCGFSDDAAIGLHGGPVDMLEIRHMNKSSVRTDQGAVFCQGVRGNEQIHWCQRFTLGFQFGAQQPVTFGASRVPGPDIGGKQQAFHYAAQVCFHGPTRQPIAQFGPGNDRHAKRSPRQCLAESLCLALDQGGNGVGVEHQHNAHGQSRSLWGPVSRSSSSAARSSLDKWGNNRSRSLTQSSNFLLRWLRMTSPVTGSRRTSTSSPSNRNSAGKRTAWLRPFLNSLAVCMMRLLQAKDIYHAIYHLHADYSSPMRDIQRSHPLADRSQARTPIPPAVS